MSVIRLHAPVLALAIVPAAVLAGGPADRAANEGLLAVDGTAIAAGARHATPDSEDRAAPVSTAFTYQGLLADGGLPANGQYDMQFTLTDELGVTVAGPICLDNVDCVDGLFTASLDFGALFDGAARELAIGVRAGGAPGDCANPIG